VSEANGFEGYDVIGDVHGHADRLEALLREMGYDHLDGAWRHPARQAVFVGDLVDRGPGQLDTIRTARAMVEAGSARIVLGNHEFNALAFATEDPDSPGHFLRPHHGERGARNIRQHEAFIGAVGGLHTPEHLQVLDWFRTVPLWLDLGGLRVVHACWHQPSIDLLAARTGPGHTLTNDLLVAASRKGSPEYEAIETILKGPEIDLGGGRGYHDKEGTWRTRARYRWWDDSATTVRAGAVIPPKVTGPDGGPVDELPDDPITDRIEPYAADVPVIVGHYWETTPAVVWHPKVACVDYSVAKGGSMVAYRWSGETELTDANFVVV
jgi:hypothetical protein